MLEACVSLGGKVWAVTAQERGFQLRVLRGSAVAKMVLRPRERCAVQIET